MKDFTIVYFNGIDRGFSIPATIAEFSIGGLDIVIKWYGLLIAVGYLLALLFGTKLAKKAKLDVDALYDAIIFGTIGGILGARIFYVLFNLDFYLANPSHILNIGEGGLAIYGGIIGGLGVGAIVCKIRKVSALDMADVAVVGYLIGQGVGRWGNFTNQEAFGINTDLPWGMMSEKTTSYLIANQDILIARGIEVDPFKGVHPTFLYESIWCILGFIILYIIFDKRRHFSGQMVLIYGVWYGFERAIVEGLRIDSLYIAGTTFRVSQVLSIVLCVVCLILLIRGLIKHKGEYVNGQEGEASEEATSGEESNREEISGEETSGKETDEKTVNREKTGGKATRGEEISKKTTGRRVETLKETDKKTSQAGEKTKEGKGSKEGASKKASKSSKAGGTSNKKGAEKASEAEV
ncbi:MAG: prolipoprotein diacylglyceryl transferase [Ruminococcaceae bacterium]|nr:prolipoprotein diacylglyceryl transferase [Oscillospiraceae bacterium]